MDTMEQRSHLIRQTDKNSELFGELSSSIVSMENEYALNINGALSEIKDSLYNIFSKHKLVCDHVFSVFNFIVYYLRKKNKL